MFSVEFDGDCFVMDGNYNPNHLSDFSHSTIGDPERFATIDYTMDPSSADNSPLWGATQLKYPSFDPEAQQQQQKPLWTDSNTPYQQVMQPGEYNPYPVPSLEGNYAELRSSPQIVEADSTIAETMYHGYQQELQPGPSETAAFQDPAAEDGSYPSSESGSGGRSPDGGYSSSSNHMFPPSYQPQYPSTEVPFQNVNQEVNSATEAVKVEMTEFKQEPAEAGAVSYQQQPNDQMFQTLNRSRDPQSHLTPGPQVQIFFPQREPNDQVAQYCLQRNAQEGHNNQQNCDNQKPIIHGNILIKPADNADPTEPIQYELVNLQLGEQNGQQNEQQVQYHFMQPTPEQQPLRQPLAQQQARNKQKQSPKKQRKQYTIHDDQQPSTSSAGMKPKVPSPARGVPTAVAANGESSENKPEGGTVRKSARPSVIERSDFKCPKCGSFFARQCGLTQHHEWIHEKRKFPCERCGKKFKTEETLVKHIKKHEMKDKPFKCPECPRQFCHKNDLRRHMYRHENTTPFKCEQCAKCFIRKDHLLAHQQSHDRRDKRNNEKENGSPM